MTNCDNVIFKALVSSTLSAFPSICRPIPHSSCPSPLHTRACPTPRTSSSITCKRRVDSSTNTRAIVTLSFRGTPQLDGVRDEQVGLVRCGTATPPNSHTSRPLTTRALWRVQRKCHTHADVRSVAAGHARSVAFSERVLQAIDADARVSCTRMPVCSQHNFNATPCPFHQSCAFRPRTHESFMASSPAGGATKMSSAT